MHFSHSFPFLFIIYPLVLKRFPPILFNRGISTNLVFFNMASSSTNSRLNMMAEACTATGNPSLICVDDDDFASSPTPGMPDEKLVSSGSSTVTTATTTQSTTIKNIVSERLSMQSGTVHVANGGSGDANRSGVQSKQLRNSLKYM